MGKVILCDVDGVLVDCARVVHEHATRILRRTIPHPTLWDDFEFAPAMRLTPEESIRLHNQLEAENALGWDMWLYEGALEFVRELEKLGQVVFVTAHWRKMPHWVVARDSLLGSCFPGRDVIYTHHKKHIVGGVLIDDSPKNIAEFVSTGRKGLLFDRPWNRNACDGQRVIGYEEALKEVGNL